MKSRYLVHGAVIAAVYTALTLLLMPLSYGVMQVRVSEALTVLPALTPAAIPGLFVGCFVSNMLGPNGMIDMILGSGATLLAAIASYKLRKEPYWFPCLGFGKRIYHRAHALLCLCGARSSVGMHSLGCVGRSYSLLCHRASAFEIYE